MNVNGAKLEIRSSDLSVEGSAVRIDVTFLGMALMLLPHPHRLQSFLHHQLLSNNEAKTFVYQNER